MFRVKSGQLPRFRLNRYLTYDCDLDGGFVEHASGQQHSASLTLNDEDCFVVDLILISSLPSMVVIFCGMLQQRIADVSS